MSLPYMWVTECTVVSPVGVNWEKEKIPPTNLFQRFRAIVGSRVYFLEVTQRGRVFLVFKGSPVREYPDRQAAMDAVDLKVVTAKLRGKI